MAKVKAVKVRDQWHLQDLLYADKLRHGERVNLLVVKHPHKKGKRKYGFVRGVLYARWVTYCSCCGPSFGAWVHGLNERLPPKYVWTHH